MEFRGLSASPSRGGERHFDDLSAVLRGKDQVGGTNKPWNGRYCLAISLNDGAARANVTYDLKSPTFFGAANLFTLRLGGDESRPVGLICFKSREAW